MMGMATPNLNQNLNSQDIERAEEDEHTSMRASALGSNKFELSTGLIVAVRFADKLRRVALVAFSKLVDKNVILRDIGELNQQLYDEIVNKRKIDKFDIIRIMVDAEYDPNENKIKFSNVRIQHFVPVEKCKDFVGDLKEKVEKLEQENQKLKETLKTIASQLETQLTS